MTNLPMDRMMLTLEEFRVLLNVLVRKNGVASDSSVSISHEDFYLRVANLVERADPNSSIWSTSLMPVMGEVYKTPTTVKINKNS
jgi:hypothetical protein